MTNIMNLVAIVAAFAVALVAAGYVVVGHLANRYNLKAAAIAAVAVLSAPFGAVSAVLTAYLLEGPGGVAMGVAALGLAAFAGILALTVSVIVADIFLSVLEKWGLIVPKVSKTKPWNRD